MKIGDVEIRDRDGNLVRDPGELEREAEYIRARLAPKPVSGQIKTPDDIITDLEWAKHLAARGAVIIRDADRTLRALQREYSARFVVAVRDAEAKSVDERKAEADSKLAELVAAVDEAEVVFEFAKRVAKSVESSTSAVQTQAQMVRVTYGLAGTGREA